MGYFNCNLGYQSMLAKKKASDSICGEWQDKGLVVTCWERADLLFVMSNCDVVTFPLVSWVR